MLGWPSNWSVGPTLAKPLSVNTAGRRYLSKDVLGRPPRARTCYV